MARSLADEVKRVNRNFLWVNTLLLLAAVGIGSIPFIFRVPKDPASLFWYVVAAPLFLLAVWNLEKWNRRSGEADAHPLLEKLKAQGFGVMEAIEHDLERSQDLLGFSLGRSWLLRGSFFNLELEALVDAVWAYSRSRHGEYMMYSQPVVHFRSGKVLSGTSTNKADKVQLFLSQLSQAAPWVILGENDDVARLWKKDRQNFLDQVDQRRKVLESQNRRGGVVSPSLGEKP
ncbi:MAG TPA: DUF6709 family protein [bacterium]|nr:DUF6709 family protein [bacterium]